MFKKILFATSASPACDHAARTAFDLAKRYNAQIILLHVLGTPSRGFGGQYVTDLRTGEQVACDNEYLQWVQEELKNIYAKQLAQCSDFRLEILVGYPHREILRIARSEDVDIIVMGASAHEKGEEEALYKKGIMGSTSQKVAKAARCPVLFINRPAGSYWGGFSNIIFGTDFSKAAEAAFLFAYKLAKALNCELHLFHVFDISAVHAGKVMDQEQIDDGIREARQKIRGRYMSNIKDFNNYNIDVWEGIPHVEIVKFAREKQADLIVMAHHTNELDPEKARLGSTVEQVVLRAICPVVSVNRTDKV
ncbi:MAG: universal stress protein [Pseudomonadota bacterium]